MFFVFGSPRSGTTLLAQCLSAHPDLVVPNETDFIIPMAFVFDRIKDEVIGRELIYRLIIHSRAFAGSLGEYLDPRLVAEALGSADYHPQAMLAALYQGVARAAGAQQAGDKSPNDLNFLRMLVKVGGLSGRSVILHIVRDIRDVMVSLEKTGWATDLDLYFPRSWCAHNLYLHALFAGEQSRYLLIRYEDLTRNPAEELARACRLLGVEFTPAMLLPENRHERYRGQGEVHANLYQPIGTASVGRYRALLDPQRIAGYESQAREALTAFGYD